MTRPSLFVVIISAARMRTRLGDEAKDTVMAGAVADPRRNSTAVELLPSFKRIKRMECAWNTRESGGGPVNRGSREIC
jgi:hypothetical protein